MANTPTTQEIHERVRHFLDAEMARNHEHQCVKLELLHTPPGDHRREQLKSWHRVAESDAPYFGDKAGPYLEKLTAEIIELAEYHAESYGGRQRFKMVSHHAHGGARHHMSFVLVPSLDSDDASMSEPAELQPTGTGQILQLMRHNENLMRMNKDMMEGFGRAMRDLVTQVREDRDADREMVRQLEKDRREHMIELEAARSKQHDQEVEAAVVLSETENKKYATKKIFGLLPVAISKMMEDRDEGEGSGNKPKRFKPSPLSIALGELGESIGDDQMDELRVALSVEQQIMLGEAMRLAKKGGSPLLPQIVEDLRDTFTREQLGVLLGKLTPDQQQMFLRVVTLAKAEASPDAAAPKSAAPGSDKASVPPNGVPQPT